MDEIDLEEEQKRPPWWFVPAVFAGMAGAASLAAVVIGMTAE